MGAWIPLITAILPQLIQLIEDLYGKGQGSVKKQAVMSAITPKIPVTMIQTSDVIARMDEASHTKMEAVGNIVDAHVAIMNAESGMPKE